MYKENELLDNNDNIVTLMDDTAKLFTLPFDLTIPFARYIARNRIYNLRRYNINKTYM